MSKWTDEKNAPAPVGTAVVFCNRQLYSPELADKRLARAAQKQAALEVGDRVRQRGDPLRATRRVRRADR